MARKTLKGLDEGDSFLTPQELAELLKIDVDTLHKWTASGKCPVPRIKRGPKFIRYRRSDVNAWLAILEERPKKIVDPLLEQTEGLKLD